MPRGKKNTTPVVKPLTDVPVNTPITGKTDLKSFLLRLRDICRNKGAQMDENGNIYADLIYDDLLFLKEVWHLVDEGILTINKEAVINGFPIKDIKLDTIASLKNGDQGHVGDVFKRLWTQLQRSNLKDIFDRDFALTNMLKDDKLKIQYLPLLTALLEYVGSVTLQEHEDTDPYEYFTQDLKKSKSKYFGQFYTPESITKTCVDEIKPKFGEIGLDPAGGTGKFMRTAAAYIHTHEPTHSGWDAFQSMRTLEIESKIYRQGILATFIKYKKLPNMSWLRKGNSFGILPTEEEQVDYILANPPYGGTVDGFEELYYDTEMVQKGKRMVKQTIVKPTIVYPFQFVKKDTCVLFLQLIVNKLKNGGRAAVVFNGTIMNDSHRDVMKWFLDNCDLRKIIVNPSGTFKCTGIETYTFVFWKGTPTQKIEYYDVGTKKKLGEFTRAELEVRGLDIRPIFADTSMRNNTIQYKSISELCDVTKGTVQATKAVPGEYPIYSGSAEVGKHNVAEFIGEAAIYVNSSSGSKGRVHYAGPGEKFSATTLVLVLKPKDENLSGKYLWYYLTLYKEHILKMFESSNMRETINTADFIKYNVALPSREIQDEIVATLDRIFPPGTTNLADTLKLTDKAMDLVLKDPTGGLLEQVVEAIRLAHDTTAHAVRVKEQMVAIVKSVGSRGFETKAIKDVMNVVGGKGNQSRSDDLPIPYYESNGIYGYVAEPLYNGEYTITARCMSIGSVHYVNGPFYPSDHTINFTAINTNVVNNRYFYYWLLLNNNLLKALSSGIKPGVRKSDVAEIKMPVPPLDFQQSILIRLSALESQLTALETLSKQSEDNARFILESYLNVA